MRTQIKALLPIFAIILFLGSTESAFAFWATNTDLTINDNSIFGKCEFIISDEEPYSHMNSHCDLDKDGFKVIGHDLSTYELGWPRSETLHEVWFLLKNGAPQANSEYCTKFGYVGGDWPLTVTLGHHSNSNQNATFPGEDTCDTAEPQVKAYFQLFCFGAYELVFSVNGLDPNVHVSYRLINNPGICWEVAVEPGQ